MTTKGKTKSANRGAVKKSETMPGIKKRGLVGVWKGKIKIIGDIDNVFNFEL